jgi:hypothetical protein
LLGGLDHRSHRAGHARELLDDDRLGEVAGAHAPYSGPIVTPIQPCRAIARDSS